MDLSICSRCAPRGRRKISRVRSRVTQEIIILISVTPEEDAGTAHEKSPEKWLLTVRLTWIVRHCDFQANNTSLVHPWSASTKEKWEQICSRRKKVCWRFKSACCSLIIRNCSGGWIQMSKLKRALFIIIGTQTRLFFQEIAMQAVQKLCVVIWSQGGTNNLSNFSFEYRHKEASVGAAYWF